MSPKIVDKEQRKQEIAVVALELFAETGLKNTSISRVAEAAGIGKGTIYEYFTSKDELISCAFMTWIDAMEEENAESLTINNAEERLLAYVRGMMDAFITDGRTVKLTIAIFQMMLQEEFSLNQSRKFRELFQRFRKNLVDMLLEGISQGIFRPEVARDAEKIAANLFAYLDGIAFHCLLNKEDAVMMPYVEFYLEQLLHHLKEDSHA